MSSSGRTKGIAFAHTRTFVVHRFGADGWSAVLSRLLPAERIEVESVIPVGWYDLGLYARTIRALDEVHGTGDLSMLVQNGRFQAERDLTTLQRMFFRMVHPANAVEKITEYWKRFHDSGAWEVRRVGEREVTGALHGWAVVDRALCREVTGYLGRVLELVGATHVVMEHTRCRALGDPSCEYRARWSGAKRAAGPGLANAPAVAAPRSGSGVLPTLVSAPSPTAPEPAAGAAGGAERKRG